MEPNTEDIVDVSFVESDSVDKIREEVVFVDGEIEGSVGGCRWGTHCGAGELLPVGVSECENIIAHDEFNGINEGSDWDMREEELVTSEVSGDFTEGFVGVDVGIHRYCIGCDEVYFSL